MWLAAETNLPRKRIDRATTPGAPWQSVRLVNEAVRDASGWVRPLGTEVRRSVVGQERLVNRLLISLLADGHLLLEGGPGLSKSSTLEALAHAMGAEYRRIPLSPDMQPADLTGGRGSEPGTGPIFSDLILADEIHLAPPRVQNALLSAMEAREMVIGNQVLPLPDPFLVVATTGSASGDQEHPLTESQADRFLMKVVLDYPHSEEEREILDLAGNGRRRPNVRVALSTEELLRARRVVASIYVDRMIKDYAVALVSATRGPGPAATRVSGPDRDTTTRNTGPNRNTTTSLTFNGASPRATVDLIRAARARAFLAGRGYVTPQDVKAVAPDVLRHRLTLRSRAEQAGITTGDVIRQVLDTVPVP